MIAAARRIAKWSPYQLGTAVVIVGACVSAAGAPTAAAYVDPSLYTSIWSIRLFGVPSVVDLGLVVLGGVCVLEILRGRAPRYAVLDHYVLAVLIIMAVSQMLAFAFGGDVLEFLAFDSERILLALASYVIVSRAAFSGRDFVVVVGVVSVALATYAAYLIVTYGGRETEFGTVTGRFALLITEDALLVGVPVLLLLGLAVDGLLRKQLFPVLVSLAAVIAFVDLWSFRRGALIFLTLALIVRALVTGRRRVLIATIAAATAALATAAVPIDSIPFRDARLVLSSTLLLDESASSEQRKTELENFWNNVDGIREHAFGSGLGAEWYAYKASPIDPASFGSGETAFIRIGWHVYGLDWLYKFGFVGSALIAGTIAIGFWYERRRLPALDPIVRSITVSLAVLLPILVLFLHTNPRIAFLSGVTAGLMAAVLGEVWPDPEADLRKPTTEPFRGDQLASHEHTTISEGAR